MSISQRKKDHLKIALQKKVEFFNKTSGFEKYDFTHCAVPELDLNSIDISTVFLNKKVSAPLMVTGITGGCREALKINKAIAEACSEQLIAVGVGSERQLFESSEFIESYRIVRTSAPNVPVIGNIGAAQLVSVKSFDKIKNLTDVIEADAIAVHLNPLQEMLQPEGDVNFKGVLNSIEKLSAQTDIPIIVKEIGCGISKQVAEKLYNAGIRYIDIAGAGGTSWAGIESFRQKERELALSFLDWGIPTAESLRQVRQFKDLHITASGGIRSGIDMAKAIALGADMCGAALPFLKTAVQSGRCGLNKMIGLWKDQLKGVLFLTGSQSIKMLRRPGVCVKSNE
ncbi:type 2 isopentenyl-diphosphate Delta-isomerase [candidate division KSB1 bacterium]|nr:MAG: type 2 isopentenyl-diphosphate Delta-isomerase [candidate division KSB1 bacterium]